MQKLEPCRGDAKNKLLRSFRAPIQMYNQYPALRAELSSYAALQQGIWRPIETRECLHSVVFAPQQANFTQQIHRTYDYK